MQPFALSHFNSGRHQPRLYGPFAFPDPTSEAGYRLTPEGLQHVRETLARFSPLAKLAMSAPRTVRVAKRYLKDHGPNELEAACHFALFEAVRRWRPEVASLSTILAYEMFAQLQRPYRVRAGVPVVFSNPVFSSAEGDSHSGLDLVPDRASFEPTGDPREELAALVKLAARRGVVISERDLSIFLDRRGYGRKLKDLADEWGLTKQRVDQITQRTLERLRSAAAADLRVPDLRAVPATRPAIKKRSRVPHSCRIACPNCGAQSGRRCLLHGRVAVKTCRARLLKFRKLEISLAPDEARA